MVRSAAAILAVMILPSFAQAQEAQEPQGTHTVVRGNTLWDLAQFYYQDPYQWRVIWEANQDVVEDPNWIYPAEMLRIPGLPGADGTPPVTTDPADPADSVQTTAPADPPEDELDDELIAFGFGQARPADEARTIFYNDTAATRAVLRASLSVYAAVSSDAVFSAPWLIRLEDVPASTGVLSGFADGGNRASTIRSYQRVRVDMPAPARVGANLQIFRVAGTIESVGRVVQPTGVMTVSTIGDGFVVGTVMKEYARIQPGDLVRPLPTFDERPGVYAEEVTGGSEAMVMGFSGNQVINDVGHIAFLDLGSDDGVTIGDEFVLYGQAVPTAREGALQVVGVTNNTASARILSLTDNVFRQGVVVRLARKMR